MELSALGITAEELREQIIERAASKLIDGSGDEYNEAIYNRVTDHHGKMTREAIDKAVQKLTNETLVPLVSEKIETLMIQETNGYGEPKKEPIPFVQFLVSRAESYLREKVNYEGKDKNDAGYGSFNGTQTRLVWLVHTHLHRAIEAELKTIVADVQKALGTSLQDTVTLKLREISKAIQVNVSTGR